MFIGPIDIDRSAVVNITSETDTFLECESALEIRSWRRINPGQERDRVPWVHLPESIDRCRVDKLSREGENIKANCVRFGISIDLVLPIKAFNQVEIRGIANWISRVMFSRNVKDFMVYQISLDFELPRG